MMTGQNHPGLRQKMAKVQNDGSFHTSVYVNSKKQTEISHNYSTFEILIKCLVVE